MRAEHDWLTAGSASNKFVLDQTSENFVEIYVKILNFGKVLKITFNKLYVVQVLQKFVRLLGGCIPASPPPPPLDPPLGRDTYAHYSTQVDEHYLIISL